MTPMKEVIAKPTGMVISCDQSASLGFLAKREKSGSLLEKSAGQLGKDRDKRVKTYTMSVAKFAIDDIIPFTIAQLNALPWTEFGWCTIGPIPCALTIAQI